MGYICNHALIVSTYSDDHAREIHRRIKALYEAMDTMQGYDTPHWAALVTDPVETITNGEYHFVILPDGSKEGWETSNDGDGMRAEAKKEILGYQPKGYAPVKYVEVAFDKSGELGIRNGENSAATSDGKWLFPEPGPTKVAP